MRVLSKEPTDLAYDGVYYDDGRPVYPKRAGKVIIKPGYNTLSETAVALLDKDSAFQRHVNDGVMVVNPEGDVEAAPADERFDAEEAEVTDERAQKPGESNTAYKKRIAALDKAEADAAAAADKPRVDFLATFNATDKAAQDAVYPTLTDEQKAWVDADRKAGA